MAWNITDEERLYVVYMWDNMEYNSDGHIALITGINKSKVRMILFDHLNGDKRIEYVEIPSKMNYE